jgi:hypothetical protein
MFYEHVGSRTQVLNITNPKASPLGCRNSLVKEAFISFICVNEYCFSAYIYFIGVKRHIYMLDYAQIILTSGSMVELNLFFLPYIILNEN